MQTQFPRFYTEPKSIRKIRRRSLSSLQFKDEANPNNTHSQNERLMVKINTLSRRKLSKLFFKNMKEKGLKTIRIGYFIEKGETSEAGKHNNKVVRSFTDLNKIPINLLKELVRMEGARSMIDAELFTSGRVIFGNEKFHCGNHCEDCPHCKDSHPHSAH